MVTAPSVGARRRVAQGRVVDEPGPDGTDKVERAGDDRAAPPRRSSARVEGRRPGSSHGRHARSAPAARQRAASSAAGSARGRSGRLVATTRGRAHDGRRGERRDDPVDVLVGHRAPRAASPARPRGAAAGRRAPRPGPRHRPGCGPRRAGRRRRRVGQQLQPAGPARARRSPRRRASSSARGDAGRLERVEQRVGDRRRWPPGGGRAARPGSGRAAAARPRCRPGPRPSSGAGSTTRSGTSSRRARRRMMASASPVAPVTARSPRSMMAAFSRAMCGDRRAEPIHVVEVDVGDGRHAAVPGVGRVEPAAEPDLDERDVEVRLGEVPEDDRGQQLELGRLAVPARDAVGDGQDRRDVPGEVRRRRSAGRRRRSARGTTRGAAWASRRRAGRPRAGRCRRGPARCPCRSCRRRARRARRAAGRRARAAGRASGPARGGCRTGRGRRARPAPRGRSSSAARGSARHSRVSSSS